MYGSFVQSSLIISSVEESIVQRAKKKLVLEHIVVEKMKESLKDDEIQDILKYGAEELFAEEEVSGNYSKQTRYQNYISSYQ